MNNLIVANWKMNKNPKETLDFLDYIKRNIQKETVICMPFTNLCVALEFTKGTNIKVGSQNCFWEDSGAFTGEISAKMLAEIEVEYTIIGHSERKTLFFETNEMINKKINSALKHGLKPILCVGESKEQKESNIQIETVINQVEAALCGIININSVIIAYEPIWAIGTGDICDSEYANVICFEIRKFIQKKYGKKTSERLKILYGGSMNVKNADKFLKEKNINGGLVGGASLNPNDFLKLLKIAKCCE